MGYWSEKTKQILQPIWMQVERGEITDRQELISILKEAYPFGVRKHSPYKTWLSHRKKLLARFDTLNKPGRVAEMRLFEWNQ